MRTPKPTVVYIVAASEPSNVFFAKDIADRAAVEQSVDKGDGAGKQAMKVYPRVVTTVNEFRKAARLAELLKLTPEQRKTLGLVRTPRKKKDATTAASAA